MSFEITSYTDCERYPFIKMDHGNGCSATYHLGEFKQKTDYSTISANSKAKATFSEFYTALVNGTTATFDWDVTDGHAMFGYDQETNVFRFSCEKYEYGASVQLPMIPQIVTELAKLLPAATAA